MPRPKINLHDKVRDVLTRTTPMGVESSCPFKHFESSVNQGLTLLAYIEDHIEVASVYRSPYEHHLGHMRRMILAESIESFERFLKDMAALCVDFLAPYTTDDRFSKLVPNKPDKIAAFINAPSLGKALCESDTWLSNAAINERFSFLLKEPSGGNWEFLFPQSHQNPPAERDRAATMTILWQIRHTFAHNLGVITHSDSMKFRLLIRNPVGRDCRLAPSLKDLQYVKHFLSETADQTNQRIVARLAELFTNFHAADSTLFDPQAKADEVSQRFAVKATINGHVGTP